MKYLEIMGRFHILLNKDALMNNEDWDVLEKTLNRALYNAGNLVAPESYKRAQVLDLRQKIRIVKKENGIWTRKSG